MSKTRKRHSIADVLRELFNYNGKLILPPVVSLLFAAAGAVLTIIGPSLLSDITDIISDSIFAEIDLAAIGRIGVKLLIIYLISAELTYVEHYIMATVTLELSRDLRRDLARKINVVPMSYFNTVSYEMCIRDSVGAYHTSGLGHVAGIPVYIQFFKSVVVHQEYTLPKFLSG